MGLHDLLIFIFVSSSHLLLFFISELPLGLLFNIFLIDNQLDFGLFDLLLLLIFSLLVSFLFSLFLFFIIALILIFGILVLLLYRLLSRYLSITQNFFIVAALVLISPLEFGVLLEPDLPVSDIVFCLGNLIITLLFILFLFLILFIVQVVFMYVLHGLELLFISKAASLDLLVQILRLVNVARQLRYTLE